jgi:signal peptidase I
VGVTAAVATRPRRSLRSGIEIFATAAVLAGAAALACLGLLRFTGHVVLIDRSDSMAPAIHAGDLLITRAVEARSIRPGDVVTFSDPTRAGQSVTHRVVSVKGQAQLDFVTRGDANDASETWSIASDGTVGRLQVVLPGVGRAIAWLGGTHGRIGLVVLPLLYLGVFALRRIWSS